VSRWYERANEASFKSAPGGYVFQCPNAWIFARPNYYLVNESKKAEILAVMGRWRLLLLSVQAIMLPIWLIPILLPGTFGSALLPAFRLLGPGLFTLSLVVVVTLLIIPLIAVPQIYLARALRPLLADAPLTEERIKVSEQLSKIATAVSGKMLVIGLIAALAMVGSGSSLLLDAYVEGRLGVGAFIAAPSLMTGGLLLTAYFAYLMRLKAKMQRTA
jgi:hypothetical protein